MTRTTVYRGRPDDHEDDALADEFHNHENDYRHAVVVKTGDGQVFKVPEDEWCDIYIDGEAVEKEVATE